jgi:hypothetical protein
VSWIKLLNALKEKFCWRKKGFFRTVHIFITSALEIMLDGKKLLVLVVNVSVKPLSDGSISMPKITMGGVEWVCQQFQFTLISIEYSVALPIGLLRGPEKYFFFICKILCYI